MATVKKAMMKKKVAPKKIATKKAPMMQSPMSAGAPMMKKGGMMKKAQTGVTEKKGAMDGLKALGKYVSTFGLATEKYNPAPSTKGAPKKAMKKAKAGAKMTKKCAYGCK
jgi:hypothetical protein